MQIVVVAPAQIKAEFQQKFSGVHEYSFFSDHNQLQDSLQNADVVFDFLLPDNPIGIDLYQDRENLVLFCPAVNLSLTEWVSQQKLKLSCALLGFNDWPTLINRPYLEVTVWREQDKAKLAAICGTLGTAYLLVDDRIGMVTPRILSMIINEAFYTLQEKTADKAAIDLAMKLGTNYPSGPFEWAYKIGIERIYQLLEVLYADTRDVRYKICPLLKKEYLQAHLKT